MGNIFGKILNLTRAKLRINVHPLAPLESGENYVIRNASDENQELLVVTLLDGDMLGVTQWEQQLVPAKTFKVEHCCDRPEECVVSTYGPAKPPKQWVVSSDNASLQAKVYPCSEEGDCRDEARLRPQSKKWRFKFEEVNPPGSNKYVIMSKDEELEFDSKNCLQLGPFIDR